MLRMSHKRCNGRERGEVFTVSCVSWQPMVVIASCTTGSLGGICFHGSKGQHWHGTVQQIAYNTCLGKEREKTQHIGLIMKGTKAFVATL